jgi:hypothetical protein
MKVWSVAPVLPLLSRPVLTPYNYAFSDNIPELVTNLADSILAGNSYVTPEFGATMLSLTTAGLLATATVDIWGPSKNTQLYIKATTLRARETGYPVMTRRDNIQRVLNEFFVFYQGLIASYLARGLYPINMPVEIRCCGLDYTGEVLLPGAQPPLLSGVMPRGDHPDWDVAIWINVLCLVGTPGSDDFYTELQDWFVGHFTGDYATLRPEWSKGWAHSPAGAYTNANMLQNIIPNWYREARPAGETWDDAVATLDRLDPFHVLSNGFLDSFLV